MFQLQNVNTNRNAREKKNLINFNPAKASKSIMNESEAGGNISNSNLKWLCVNWMERNSIEQQRKLQRIWNWTIEWKIHPSFQLENKNGKKAAPTLCFQFQSQTECGQQNWTEEKYCHFGVANKGWEREREWKEIGISKLSCIMPFWLNPLRVPLSCAVGPIPLLFVHIAHPRHGRQILLFFDDTGDKLEYNWLILAFSR